MWDIPCVKVQLVCESYCECVSCWRYLVPLM